MGVHFGSARLEGFSRSVLFHYVYVLYCVVLLWISSLRVPAGLAFTWWGCYSLRLWHKATELAHSSLFCFCIYFCLYGPFNCISTFHRCSRQLSVFFGVCVCFLFLTLFFRFYLCLIGPSNCISLYESLLQPWYKSVVVDLAQNTF